MISILIKIFQGLFNGLRTVFDIMKGHILGTVIVIAIVALLAYAYEPFKQKLFEKMHQGRVNHVYNKQRRKANRAAARDTKAIMNLIDEILGLIDQRMSVDPNPQALNMIKSDYLAVREELSENVPINYNLGNTLYRYYQLYGDDRSSQLVVDMRRVNRLLGFQY